MFSKKSNRPGTTSKPKIVGNQTKDSKKPPAKLSKSKLFAPTISSSQKSLTKNKALSSLSKSKTSNLSINQDKTNTKNKQNKTPIKKYTQNDLSSPPTASVQLESSEKKTNKAAIKNLKAKIMGQSGNKTSHQSRVVQSHVLRQRQENQQLEASHIKIEELSNTKDRRTLQIQDFQFGKRLGRGRFGDVCLAKHKQTGFILAVKTINKKSVMAADMQKQLIQQIKTQSFSEHPNILKMYGCLHDDQSIYLLLELASEGCLFSQLQKVKHFTQDQACSHMRQVQSGLKYLHAHGVIHRDLKPQNIVSCFGVLKLCDFGWAVYSPVYQRQTFCGTLDYVSPEIVSGDYYDEKVDIWCLGVLCYELCIGKPPFEAKTNPLQVYNKILNVQIEYPINMSLKLVDFLGRVLEREPGKRLTLAEVQDHEWVKQHENEPSTMIRKQIWQSWVALMK